MPLSAGVAGVLASLIASSAMAEFPLVGKRINGQAANTIPFIDCNRGEGALNCARGTAADSDHTPFLQELVRGEDQRTYYHTIIGSLDSGDFFQEVFIEASGAVWQGGIGSASGGRVDFSRRQQPLADATISGNGTGNPTKVVMRQIVRDEEFVQEFVKDRLLYKPRITETLSDGEIAMRFDVDMRNLKLTELTDPAPVINTLVFASTDKGEFDMARDAPGSQVDAGQYRWLPGSGPGGSGGTYEYGGSVAHLLVDWASFRDPEQNPPSKSP